MVNLNAIGLYDTSVAVFLSSNILGARRFFQLKVRTHGALLRPRRATPRRRRT